MNRLWKYFVPGHVWCLPLTLGYALFCLVVYRAHSFQFRDGILSSIGGTKTVNGQLRTRIFGDPGAQTIGAAQCFASEYERKRAELRVHENTHVVEAFICASLVAIGATAQTAIVGGPLPVAAMLGVGGLLGVLLYSLAYVVIFLAFYLTKQNDEKAGWVDDYRRNYLEVWAYANEARYLKAAPIDQARMWGHQ